MTIDAASILADATKAKAKADQVAAQAKERSVLAWQPVDIAALIGAGLKLPETALLERKDGLRLFYPARLHSLIGDSESLKTWVSLLATYQEISKANRVLFLDYEDSPAGVIGRMLDFGVSKEDLAKYFIYIRPDAPLDEAGKDFLRKLIEKGADHSPVTLVVIDGVTEVMSINGWKVNEQEDVARLYNEMAKWFTSLGPAVVMIDHVVKSNDNRGLHAIGAQHKRAGIDGASYIVTNADDFGYGKHGRSTLRLAKDKNGTVRSAVDKGEVGTFHITSDPVTHAVEAWIDLPGVTTVKGISGVPNSTVQAILDYVKANKHCSKNQVATNVKENRQKVMNAIDKLIAQGFIENIGSGTKTQLVWMRDAAEKVFGLEDV